MLKQKRMVEIADNVNQLAQIINAEDITILYDSDGVYIYIDSDYIQFEEQYSSEDAAVLGLKEEILERNCLWQERQPKFHVGQDVHTILFLSEFPYKIKAVNPAMDTEGNIKYYYNIYSDDRYPPLVTNVSEDSLLSCEKYDPAPACDPAPFKEEDSCKHTLEEVKELIARQKEDIFGDKFLEHCPHALTDYYAGKYKAYDEILYEIDRKIKYT